MSVNHSGRRKAVFIDRDGVIIALNPKDEAHGFILRKDEISILPSVKEALRKLKEKGYLLIVVTNQPAVARGLIEEKGIEELHEFINEQLNRIIDAFYFCPHHPQMYSDVPSHAKKYRIACDCRKPSPGMILKAVKDFDIDLDKSWVIGDMASDVAMGKAAGCKTIMIKSAANERIIVSSHEFDPSAKPDFYANNLLDAERFI
ncbi:MAG: HAD family hydrolase [Candidatus Staskawiczbacteria bacterium]|nr:HAD family hydrolase [Candidatus Staskawiczbacteria bacterium]